MPSAHGEAVAFAGGGGGGGGSAARRPRRRRSDGAAGGEANGAAVALAGGSGGGGDGGGGRSVRRDARRDGGAEEAEAEAEGAWRRREVLIVGERPQHASHLGVVEDKLQGDRQRERRPREGVKNGEAATHTELARAAGDGRHVPMREPAQVVGAGVGEDDGATQPEDEDGDEGHEERGDQILSEAEPILRVELLRPHGWPLV